ncbi:MAG: hypothetical protein JW837_05325 [Sedimentisphaerales bacterium]|nr:hypothetical protein [Sedimentisphaerales bacterium]
MWNIKKYLVIFVILNCLVTTYAADVILNEYNAVGSNEFLNGGDAAADADGGRAFDSYFGRIQVTAATGSN